MYSNKSTKYKVLSTKYQKGQTLLEVVVVVAVSVLVVGALVFATIASLRNAQFANSQARAVALAQEGQEKIRSIRDRDATGMVLYNYGNGTTSKFSDLYNYAFGCTAVLGYNCYFYFSTSGILNSGTVSNLEKVATGFTRQVQIEDGNLSSQEKKITVVVYWTDFAGTHSSKLSTLLRKL